MHDYFDEPVAARYDETSAEMFDPAVVEPAVDVLAGLAGALTSDSRKHVSVWETAADRGQGRGPRGSSVARHGLPGRDSARAHATRG